jgi:uncharacterized membrane protein YidH (DUF202 family)
MSKTVKIVLVVVAVLIAIYVYYRWQAKKKAASKNVVTSPTAAVNITNSNKAETAGGANIISEGPIKIV